MEREKGREGTGSVKVGTVREGLTPKVPGGGEGGSWAGQMTGERAFQRARPAHAVS